MTTKSCIYKVISTKKCILDLVGCAILNIWNQVHHWQCSCAYPSISLQIQSEILNIQQSLKVNKSQWNLYPCCILKVDNNIISPLAYSRLLAFSNSIKSFLYSTISGHIFITLIGPGLESIISFLHILICFEDRVTIQ